MPIARFQLPDGRIARFEVPDGTSPEAAQQMMEAQLPSLLEKKPQTTLGGNVKEFFKGIPAGGVNLLETAFTGAAAMLPEKAEEGARITAKEMAEAARKPFEAAKGYEDAVTRKLGEGVGSTLPFFLLGPAGTAGRVAGAGLGIAAGAGEARQEAEAKGEMGDARMWSTLLGAPVGALDLIAPEIKAGKSMIVNALKRGGMEGATEAAQKVAQNLIAKGLYDPERSTLGGAGEEGAYGAGTGALISFLLDATLGKAGRGVNIQPTKPGQPTPDEAAQQARREALAKEQMNVAAGKEARAGEKLLKEEEKLAAKEEDLARADRLAAMDQLNAQARAQREEELKAAFPADYSDVMQRTDAYAELAKELDSLGTSKTREAVARRGQIRSLMAQIVEEDSRVPVEFARVQREQEKLAKAAGFPAKKSAAGFLTAPAQMEMREAMLEPGQELPPQYDLQGNVIEPETPTTEPTKRFPTFKTAEDALRGQKRAETAAAKEAEALRLEQEAAGQMGFDFGRRSKKPLAQPSIEPEVAATTTEEKAPVPEPKLVKKAAPVTPDQLPTVVTPDVLGSLGIGRTATIRKADHGIMNKDISDPAQAAEVKSILEAYRSRPNLSPAIAEKVDAYLARPEFKAAAPAAPVTQGETDVGPIEQEGRGAGLPAPVKADTRSAAPTVAEPERTGMVPAGQDVGPDIGREGEPAAPVAEQLAKYEGLHGATRAGAIRGEIAMNNKVLARAQERGETVLIEKLTQENARLEALLPEAEARDARDSRTSVDKGILGQAKSELDTAVANGELTQDEADKLVEDARKTGNVADASEKILEGVDETEPRKLTGMFDQLTAPREAQPEEQKPAAPKAKEAEKEEYAPHRAEKFDIWNPKSFTGIGQQIAGEVNKEREARGEKPLVPAAPLAEMVEEQSPAEKQVQSEAEQVIDESLTGADKMVLAKHYKQKSFNKAAKTAFLADVTTAINEGIEAVATAIHKYIQKVVSGLMAVTMSFNMNFTMPAEAITVVTPKTYTEQRAVLAQVPAEAAKFMSPAAKTAYETILPAIKADLTKRDKLFIINDKPSARTFLFTPDGKMLMQSKTLQGAGVGDLYKGNNDIVVNRVTPAGLFNLEMRDAAKGAKSAQGYDTGKVFGINDSEAYITIMHSVWTKESDAAKRLAALNNDSISDSRYSFGCINVDKATYKNMLEKHESQMDGAKIFIVPDNQARVKDFISGDLAKNVVREDKLLRQSVEPVTETVTRTEQTAKKVPNLYNMLYGKPQETVLDKPAAEVTAIDRASALEGALQAKIQEGDVRGALKSIVDADPALYNEVDRLVAKRLLLSSSLPTVQVVPEGSLGRDGDKVVAGQYDAVTDTVRLADGYIGAHTLLHEMVHGFVHRAISAHEGGRINNAGVRNLRELYDYMAKADPKIMQQYGMTNLSEFASEAMSNKDFQKVLQRTVYRRQSIFTQFARAVLKTLGLGDSDQHTALAAALISVESIMSEGRAMQVAETGTAVRGSLPGVANVAVGITPSDVEEVKRISSSFGPDAAPSVNGLINESFQAMNRASEKAGLFQAFRQAAVDKYASVESKISNMFSKGVRDAFGNLNPMVLVRQAEDHAKVFMSYISDGGIRFNKEGLVETYKQDASAVKALDQLKKLADKSNMTFDEAKTYVSSVLEGHRAHDIHENHNKLLEASALTLEGQGKNKEADAERAKKINLHLTLAQIAALEAKYQKSPEIQAIQDTFNKTRGTAIDLMVQSGRLSKEQGDDWKANSAYVPFDRVMEAMGENPMPRGKGLGVMTATPKIKGSLDKRVKDVIDSYMGTLGWMVEESMRHNASTKLLNEMATAGFAEKLPTPNAATNKNLVVRLYEDGKPVHYQVQNEYDMLAFQQAPEINNWLVKGLAATSRALRVSVTAMPPFAVKQVVEDATRAAMYSGVQRPLVVAMKTLYNMPKVFFGEVFGHKSVAAKRMEALGIVGDYDFNIYQPTLEIEKEIGAMKRGVAGTIFHTLEKFTKASDMAARLAVYEETMRETGGDEVLAQTRARELINFNRRGASSSMRLATRVIPFFNAYAQGMDVLYRAASGIDSSSSVDRASARKMFMSRVAMMTAMGFAYALAMSDDDGYKKATDDVRDNNWLLPNGYKLPVPKELGFIYKTIPERVVEYMRRAGGPEEQSAMDALAGIVKAGYSAYSSPTTVPSYVRPILENMTNYSFFLQRELESASMQAKVPGQRYNSSTSEFAKALGEATNTSPIKIDNLLKGMFGMAGSTTLLATDALLNPTRPDRPLYQMPFGSIFLYDTEGGRGKAEFYDLRERSAQAVATFEDLRLKDPNKAEKFLEENQGLIAAAPKLNSTLEQLSTLRRMRLMIEQGTEEQLGVDSAERRRMLDELKGYENDVTSDIRMLEKELRDLQ